MKYLFLIFLNSLLLFHGFSQSVCIKGTVKDAETGKLLSGVEVNVNSLNSYLSNKNGGYSIHLSQASTVRLTFSLLGYTTVAKTIENPENDTILLNIKLSFKSYQLPEIGINATRKVDTVFGTWKFSVADFEFYEDKLLLLTFKKNMKDASIVLADYSQHILIDKKLNFEAKELTKDYRGNSIIIGAEKNYFITIIDKSIYLEEISKADYEATLKPIIDEQEEKIYFSNYNTKSE
jgi:hypothetical protein